MDPTPGYSLELGPGLFQDFGGSIGSPGWLQVWACLSIRPGLRKPREMSGRHLGRRQPLAWNGAKQGAHVGFLNQDEHLLLVLPLRPPLGGIPGRVLDSPKSLNPGIPERRGSDLWVESSQGMGRAFQAKDVVYGCKVQITFDTVGVRRVLHEV